MEYKLNLGWLISCQANRSVDVDLLFIWISFVSQRVAASLPPIPRKRRIRPQHQSECVQFMTCVVTSWWSLWICQWYYNRRARPTSSIYQCFSLLFLPARRSAVRNGPQNDVRKRFPDWSSSDEASPAKTPRRNEPTSTPSSRRPSDASSNDKSGADSKNNRQKSNSGPSKKAEPATKVTPPPSPKLARRKLTDIQFQERRQLLLCNFPDATEKSLRRAIEVTETIEEAEDWFFKFGEQKASSTSSGPGKTVPAPTFPKM